MTCSGRYAQAAEFASFWCTGGVLRGQHTGAVDVAVLTNALESFITKGVKVGDFVRNDADGSTGQILAVTSTTISALLVGGGWRTYGIPEIPTP